MLNSLLQGGVTVQIGGNRGFGLVHVDLLFVTNQRDRIKHLPSPQSRHSRFGEGVVKERLLRGLNNRRVK